MPSTFNPTKLRFQASPDHSATLFDGSPALTEYRVEYVGTGAPPQSSLGKPTPGTGQIIEVPLPGPFTGTGPYLARVGAKGPGGISWAQGTDAFGFVPAPAAPTNVSTV